MPELPEIENFRRYYERELTNKKIISVEVVYERIIRNVTPDEFVQRVVGQTIHRVGRMGKMLLFFLDHDIMITHFRMTGNIVIRPSSDIEGPHSTSLAIQFNNNKTIFLRDWRRFATVDLIPLKDYLQNPLITKQGLEPFDPRVTIDYLWTHWRKRTVPIKLVFLEQNLIAGIGNIYASEILYAAKISPFLPVNKLTKRQIGTIIREMRRFLNLLIDNGGISGQKIYDLDDVLGREYHLLEAYYRKGMPCNRCKTPIIREQLRGRGTYYCPKCQLQK